MFCSILLICLATEILAIDADYYFSKSLRSEEKQVCFKNGSFGELYCLNDCKSTDRFCLKNNCYCIQTKAVAIYELNGANTIDNHKTIVDMDNDIINIGDNTAKTAKIRVKRVKRGEYKSLRPVLRHHIAHFCPNLDEARMCIRKCMKMGKPAFCGKDHQCYCGHRYTSHDVDREMDPQDVYANFKDMYAKYFGRYDENSSHNNVKNTNVTKNKT